MRVIVTVGAILAIMAGICTNRAPAQVLTTVRFSPQTVDIAPSRVPLPAHNRGPRAALWYLDDPVALGWCSLAGSLNIGTGDGSYTLYVCLDNIH